MNKLILSFGFIISSFNFVFGDPGEVVPEKFSKKQEKLAQNLVESARQEIYQESSWENVDWKEKCRNLLGKRDERGDFWEKTFNYKGRITSLQEEQRTLLTFFIYRRNNPNLVRIEEAPLEIIQLVFEEKLLILQSKEYAQKFFSAGLYNAILKNLGIDVIGKFIEYGADVNFRSYQGGPTPLIFAAQNGRMEVVDLLLQKGANVNARAGNGATALILASQNGYEEIVAALLDKGADINIRLTNDNFTTALVSAVDQRCTKVVRVLLKSKANFTINVYNALVIAIQNRYTEGENALLRFAKEKKWCARFMLIAAEEGHVQIVDWLIRNGVDIDAQLDECDNATPLIMAAQNGHKKVVDLLLQNKPNIEAQKNGGYTALMVAIQCGGGEDVNRNAIVNLLLNYGAKVDTPTKKKCTALMIAAQFGRTEIVKLLLKREADVDARTDDGITALMAAAQYGRTEIVKALLDKGANVDAKTKFDTTPIEYAIFGGNIDIVELLLRRGVEVKNVIIPNNINYEKSRESLRMLIEQGLPIGNIPSKFLCDEVIGWYVGCIGYETPLAKTKAEQVTEFFKSQSADLSQEHREKILGWSKHILTESQYNDLCETLRVLPPKKQTSHVTVSLFDIVETGHQSPTVTLKRKMKASARAVSRSQVGLANTPSKEEEPESPILGELRWDKLFKLTPKVKSKRLKEKSTGYVIEFIDECIQILRNFEISFELKDSKNHPRISLDRIDPECKWAIEFYNSHKKPNRLTTVHGSTKACTDHYDTAASYLVHYICLLVVNGVWDQKTWNVWLEKYSDNLDIDKIRELYPAAFSDTPVMVSDK